MYCTDPPPIRIQTQFETHEELPFHPLAFKVNQEYTIIRYAQLQKSLKSSSSCCFKCFVDVIRDGGLARWWFASPACEHVLRGMLTKNARCIVAAPQLKHDIKTESVSNVIYAVHRWARAKMLNASIPYTNAFERVRAKNVCVCVCDVCYFCRSLHQQ